MKYYVIAGEASGDMHAANAIEAIKAIDPNAEFRGWGGDEMLAQGVVLVKHYKDLAYMGFWEVFTHLFTILKNLSFCKKDILNTNPDAIIFVDYPGFNLRMAKFAKKKGFKTIYYVSPQVWAWKKKRVFKIKKYVDKLLTILPFEEDFYNKYDYKVYYVGHPSLDVIKKYNHQLDTTINFREKYHLDNRPIVALLPGSRKQEIKSMLPVMLSVIDKFPDYQFLISKVKWQPKELYTQYGENITLVEDDMYGLLSNATAAIVTSGTASLETALFNVPQVVGYRGSELSYRIALLLVKGIKYISIANLILDKQVFQELIQHDMNPKRLETELNVLLFDTEKIEEIKKDYHRLRVILGDGGASKKVAETILS